MSRRALIASALGTAALLAGAGGVGTYAVWTDTQQLDAGTVAAGSLDLQVEGSSTTYAWSALGMVQVAPGESVASSVTLSNAGTTPFTTVLSGRASRGLAAYATVTVRTGATATSDDTYPRQEACQGGAQVWSGTLTGSDVQLGTLAGLAAATTRPLCVSVLLPQAAANAAQGLTMTPTFTLDAAQELP